MNRYVTYGLYAALGLCLPGAAHAQTYFNVRAPTGGGKEFITSILPTDSGYVASGESLNYPIPGTYSIFLRHFNRAGQQQRAHYFGQTNYSYGAGAGANLHPLPLGGYVVAGGVHLPGGQDGAKLWRFTTGGDTLWTRTYLPGPYTWLYGSFRTRDGGFALVGQVFVPTVTQQLILLLRTDSTGRLLWQSTYRLQDVNTGWTVAELPDGGFVIGGTTSDLGYVRQGTYVVRTDAAGNQLWSKRLGDPVLQNGIGIVRLTRDGNLTVLASTGRPERVVDVAAGRV